MLAFQNNRGAHRQEMGDVRFLEDAESSIEEAHEATPRLTFLHVKPVMPDSFGLRISDAEQREFLQKHLSEEYIEPARGIELQQQPAEQQAQQQGAEQPRADMQPEVAQEAAAAAGGLV